MTFTPARAAPAKRPAPRRARPVRVARGDGPVGSDHEMAEQAINAIEEEAVLAALAGLPISPAQAAGRALSRMAIDTAGVVACLHQSGASVTEILRALHPSRPLHHLVQVVKRVTGCGNGPCYTALRELGLPAQEAGDLLGLWGR